MAKKNYIYGGKAVAVMEWLNTEPSATDAHIAKHVGCHPTYVKQIRRKMVHAQQEEPKPTSNGAEVLREMAQESMDALLQKREDQYGSFMFNANIAIRLKGVIHNAIAQKDLHLAPDQMLALDMIAVKISRILSGNPSHKDSWVDIAGYAKLVADRLQGTVR
jgi:hypothetical protein